MCFKIMHVPKSKEVTFASEFFVYVACELKQWFLRSLLDVGTGSSSRMRPRARLGIVLRGVCAGSDMAT